MDGLDDLGRGDIRPGRSVDRPAPMAVDCGGPIIGGRPHRCDSTCGCIDGSADGWAHMADDAAFFDLRFLGLLVAGNAHMVCAHVCECKIALPPASLQPVVSVLSFGIELGALDSRPLGHDVLVDTVCCNEQCNQSTNQYRTLGTAAGSGAAVLMGTGWIRLTMCTCVHRLPSKRMEGCNGSSP